MSQNKIEKRSKIRHQIQETKRQIEKFEKELEIIETNLSNREERRIKSWDGLSKDEQIQKAKELEIDMIDEKEDLERQIEEVEKRKQHHKESQPGYWDKKGREDQLWILEQRDKEMDYKRRTGNDWVSDHDI